MLDTHASLFRSVEAQTGVPGRYIVAFWGLESNFGDNTGGFKVMESLATLACEGRRGQFFTAELRSEEHTSELQSLMRISYAVFCLKKKNTNTERNDESH